MAARGIGDRPVAPAKMLKLLFPAAMIAGEFMDEDDRRSASSFLVVQPYAVISGSKGHGQPRFHPLKTRSRSMALLLKSSLAPPRTKRLLGLIFLFALRSSS